MVSATGVVFGVWCVMLGIGRRLGSGTAGGTERELGEEREQTRSDVGK